MTRAPAVTAALAALGCHTAAAAAFGCLSTVHGTSDARPCGQSPIRVRYRPTCFVAPPLPLSPSTRERERSMSLAASSAMKAPWGVASWVGPQARRRHHSERPWGTKPHQGKGYHLSCTTAAEEADGAEQAGSELDVDASGDRKEAGTIGSLALPLGVNNTGRTRITSLKFDNLRSKQSVSFEVSSLTNLHVCSPVVKTLESPSCRSGLVRMCLCR